VILTGRQKPPNKLFDRSAQSEFASFFQSHVTRPVNSSVRCQWCPNNDEVYVRQMDAQQPEEGESWMKKGDRACPSGNGTFHCGS
jgi:hypothetical protein